MWQAELFHYRFATVSQRLAVLRRHRAQALARGRPLAGRQAAELHRLEGFCERYATGVDDSPWRSVLSKRSGC